ncbi:MAG: DUF975 family protein [Butyrivibrio sp.]|nr:DUF975 family protein [Butyrivibrio sp.]
MWSRKEVKAKGKESFKRNYWRSVLVAFIYTLFFVATGTATYKNKDEITSSFNFSDDPSAIAIALLVLGIVGVILLVIVVVDIFLLNPLEVGCNRFFLTNLDSNAQLSEMGYAYKNNYIAVVVGIFLRDLAKVLGIILFVIPGIILAYSYRLVPYILADDPTIDGVTALKKSRMMMKGHKWATFVYDLSFILWNILGAITCNIVNIFYVHPYKYSSNAELYRTIKRCN